MKLRTVSEAVAGAPVVAQAPAALPFVGSDFTHPAGVFSPQLQSLLTVQIAASQLPHPEQFRLPVTSPFLFASGARWKPDFESQRATSVAVGKEKSAVLEHAVDGTVACDKKEPAADFDVALTSAANKTGTVFGLLKVVRKVL